MLQSCVGFVCCHELSPAEHTLLQARLSSVTPLQTLLKANRFGQVYSKLFLKKEIKGGKKKN